MVAVSIPAGDDAGTYHRAAWCIVLGYPFLYSLGFLFIPMPAAAAVWPAHALSFFAFLVLPFRRWALLACGIVVSEILSITSLDWATSQPQNTMWSSAGFAVANVLTTACPAALARLLGIVRTGGRPQFVISPLWLFVLFAGVLPGALLGADMHAVLADEALAPANVGLWGLASVLTIVTLGPMVFGVIQGFAEPAPAPARRWEAWTVALLLPALLIAYVSIPWPAGDGLVEPMLFIAPLVWLALRFSHRMTSIGVVFVVTGIVLLTGRGSAADSTLKDIDDWRYAVISLDIFLLVSCGGALLVNFMTLKQRALLTTLAEEHAQLRRYAQALDVTEENARRATAADLHDGIGQVLAGQSMTLAAMRRHATDDHLAELVEEAAAASREAQQAIRVMIQDLSPPELDHASMDEAIGWLASLFMARFGFRVNYRIDGAADLPQDLVHLVFRCTRELLMNARKHSQRQRATVSVAGNVSELLLIVSDDGVGFDADRSELAPGQRFGLAQLRERVRAAGGSVTIDAASGQGCRIYVRIVRLSLA